MAKGARSWARWILGAALVAAAAWVALRAQVEVETAAPPAPPCPVGFLDQPARGSRLLARLGRQPAAAALVERVDEGRLRFCFGEVDLSLVTPEGLLLLDRGETEDELVARAGHLLHHVVQGPPLPAGPPPDGDCARAVERALEAEAAAYVLEARLRADLGLPPDRYEFEPALANASPAEGRRRVARYLREHPDGTRNLDALARSYRRRCEQELGAAAAEGP